VAINNNCAYAQDFDIKFPADLSSHDGGTAGGADNSLGGRGKAVPSDLLPQIDPVSPPPVDPMMEEGSPIPDVVTVTTPEKKSANTGSAKVAAVASATELFEGAKKHETNQEFGKALSSYEEAIKLFRSSRNDSAAALQNLVAQKYAALLKKLNNPQKAALIEKEFGASQP
jgi:hypothetical protein